MFKSLFKRGTKKPETIELPEFFGMTIGRAVTLDALSLQMMPSDSLLIVPDNDMIIIAQGFTDLGEQSFMHRFYTDDDRFMLQVQGGDGINDKRIDEIMLWYFYDVQYLSSKTSWDSWLSKIGRREFHLYGEKETSFERAWFNAEEEQVGPMTYWESVRDTPGDVNGTRIFQYAMLFGRGLSDGSDEMLLVNMEENDDERSISFMVGQKINQYNIST